MSGAEIYQHDLAQVAALTDYIAKALSDAPIDTLFVSQLHMTLLSENGYRLGHIVLEDEQYRFVGDYMEDPS